MSRQPGSNTPQMTLSGANGRRVLNGYRAAAGLMADARALNRATGNTDESLTAYRRAAAVTAAARQLDRTENR